MTQENKPAPTGAIKEKLIRTKERWAREGRLLTGEGIREASKPRLPPGQREVADWPILDLGLRPRIDPSRWELVVDGAVVRPLRWDWPALIAQPMIEAVSDIHCVTAWSRFDNRWRGVSARHILAAVEPHPDARFIVFHAYDDYTTNLPLADFDQEDALLATHWEEKPLAIEHGGPARIVIPRLYFWKSAKWVRRIEILSEDRPSFWEVRGYHGRGDPWREERYR